MVACNAVGGAHERVPGQVLLFRGTCLWTRNLKQACKDLAAADLATYQREHNGRNPTQEDDRATADRLFAADWKTLQAAGAGQGEAIGVSGLLGVRLLQPDHGPLTHPTLLSNTTRPAARRGAGLACFPALPW